MVGQLTATKPSRSDEVLDSDQQLKITSQIRAQFDSMAPKRPTKPNRSEPDLSLSPSPVETTIDQTIPELDKLRSLQAQSQVVISDEGDTTVTEEFVETQYYRELDSIDKQHHTTGSGFIKVVKEGSEEGDDQVIQLREGHFGGVGTAPGGYRSNPATNDWVPKIDEDQIFISSKPNRSEIS
ncbi:hypothetical protein L484_009299 [Morus notabilis]|uniref:Maternal effect embryo arrest 59 n=1 Tax=Morus notabilis TaxID=981085 RepID=W9QYM1_9ROSA|nr:uncharacterized protein LOC21392636 [Morus notabilis]EXB59541.1 hypothetical protein L484_009299 [Morus notabilis]